MSKIQVHVPEAYWNEHFLPILADIQEQLGTAPGWTDDDLQRRAAFDPRLVPAARLREQFWRVCVLGEVGSVKVTMVEVQFADGPHIRLEVDYPGNFPLVEPVQDPDTPQ